MTRARKYDAELELIEVQLLIEAVRKRAGIDLEGFSGSILRRRIWAALREEKARTISGLLEKLLHDSDALRRFLDGLTRVEPSRPEFFRLFREEITPRLRTYPFVRIWQAGCESLRDLYFTAIILHEEGLYEKSTLYVTDVNEANLERAKEGVFALAGSRELSKAYDESGGRGRVSEYFSGGRYTGFFKPTLRRNMVFAQHNLTTDSSFNEFNMIICRHSLEAYSDAARHHAHEVLYESLGMFGTLALGPRDTLRNTPRERRYEALDDPQKLFRKIA
jgi:chemotaxis protein methyltransferase CheR